MSWPVVRFNPFARFRAPFDNTQVTIELGKLVEAGVDIWDFDYLNYYHGEEKKAFEQKVIDHYYFRQIGQESPGRWLHMFRSRIREIMPYYLQLYKSVEIMKELDDPFGNVNIEETFEQVVSGAMETKGKSSGEENRVGNNKKEHKFLDTPQGSVANLTDGYLTEVTIDDDTASDSVESSGSNESNTTNTSTMRTTFRKVGNQGVNTYAHDMVELRQTFLNVDMQIINELSDLFLGVY